MDFIYLVSAGLIGGFLAGLLGIGGGIIYILILPTALEKIGVCDDQLISYVVANSIFTVLFVSIAANAKLIFNKTFPYRIVAIIGLSGALSSVLAMQYIVQSSWYSKLEFNIVVLLLLVVMLIRLFMQLNSTENEKPEHLVMYVVIGVLAGLAAALSGLGGGIIVVPMLIFYFKMDAQKAKTISLGVIGLLSLIFTIKNLLANPSCEPDSFSLGYIALPISLIMSVGVLLGTPLGIRLAKVTPDKWLKMLFSTMLFIVILKKLFEVSNQLGWL